MFRIIPFILLFFLCIFGIFQVFFSSSFSSPEERNARFMSILSSAIERSEGASKKYTSIFSQEDIQKILGNPNEEYIYGVGNSSFFRESEFNKKQLEQRNEMGGEKSAQKNINLPKANLGVLALREGSQNSFGASDINFGGSSSESCHGIIFDPCIVLPDISNSGKKMWFEMAPIYPYPNGIF